MPTSRSRITKSKRRRKKPSSAPFYRDKDVVRLKTKVFDSLRENEDFIAMVRIGRVFNLLDYSFYLIANPSEAASEEMQSRHRVRALWNCAGYLSEGLDVVSSIRLKYASENFFSPFLRLFADDFKRERQIVKKIRNSVAFHLDNDATATTEILKRIKLPHYEFFSVTDGELKSANFPLAEVIDLNYLVNETMGSQYEENGDAFPALMRTILNFRQQYFEAAWVFIRGIGGKLGLMIPDSSHTTT